MATWKNKRDTALNWANNNPILDAGVIGIVKETGQFKFGNGVSHWDGLPLHSPDVIIEELIAEYVDSLPTGEVTQQDLDDHINSTNPHPQYDSGLDLTVLYENVKAG